MSKENSIDLTNEEVLMIRSFCENTLASEPQNAILATSILEKLSTVKSFELSFEDKPTLKKRGRPLKTKSVLPKEIPPLTGPKPVELNDDAPVLDEEPLESQPLVNSVNTESTQTVSEQPTTKGTSYPRLNFLQHLLQRIRPAVRQ